MLVEFYTEPVDSKQITKNKETIDNLYRTLLENEEALAYLKLRGISRETIDDFKLGYCPSSVKEYIPGSMRTLENRIVIPINDAYGTPVALAGRSIDPSDKLKYWHPKYNKKNFLWNLDKSKKQILVMKYCIIVEGFMHAITLWQNGVKHCVALQGCSFQKERANFLTRYTKTVALITDNDKAGDKSWNSISKLLRNSPYDMTVFRVRIPEEFNDVDEYILKSPEEASYMLSQLKVPMIKSKKKIIDTIRLKEYVINSLS